MPDPSHFYRLCSIISGLAASGLTVHVFTGQRMRPAVEGAGGHFVDLFEKHSLDSADAESVPLPSRLVTYAGRFADHVARRVAALSPSLVVHDTFAVVGWVVADMLGIPRVNVCAGHNVVPVADHRGAQDGPAREDLTTLRGRGAPAADEIRRSQRVAVLVRRWAEPAAEPVL